jgi:spermidine synthase
MKLNNFSSSSCSSFSYLVLIILVLIAGAVVMALEFASSRLLVPIYGSSIYTWGSLVGIILSGLSLGYHVGGRLADKIDSSFVKFCSIIFSAGLYIVFMPFISTTIIGISDSTVSELSSVITSSLYSNNISTSSSSSNASSSNSQYACLLATFLLLLLPTFLLGLISPYAVKLATINISIVGNISGNLYSAATIGSIIGTFLTVFVLIPAFDTRSIIFGLGLSLLISSALTGLGRVPKILTGSVVLFLFLSNTFLAVNPVPYYSGKLVYQKETPYSHLDVVDSDHKRALFLDGNIHTIMSKDNPTQLFIYTKYFPLGFVFNPTAKKVLFVGGGGFSGPKYFLKTYPNITVDVVEIDPVVINVAKKYFDVDASNPRLKIYNEDARNFLSRTNQKYDIIVLDAYSKNYVPFHLMTLGYYQLLYNRLTTPNGVIVSNQLGSLAEEQDTSKLYRAVYKTMSQVFSSPSAAVYAFPLDVGNIDNVQNIILVAIKDPDVMHYSSDDIRQMQQEQLQQQQQRQKILVLSGNNNNNSLPTNNDLISYADHLYDRTKIKTSDVPILTDQFAPVENLLNPITSTPYNIKEKETPANRKIDLYSVQGTTLGLVLPVAVTGLWIFYMQRSVWKVQEEE